MTYEKNMPPFLRPENNHFLAILSRNIFFFFFFLQRPEVLFASKVVPNQLFSPTNSIRASLLCEVFRIRFLFMRILDLVCLERRFGFGRSEALAKPICYKGVRVSVVEVA